MNIIHYCTKCDAGALDRRSIPIATGLKMDEKVSIPLPIHSSCYRCNIFSGSLMGLPKLKIS